MYTCVDAKAVKVSVGRPFRIAANRSGHPQTCQGFGRDLEQVHKCLQISQPRLLAQHVSILMLNHMASPVADRRSTGPLDHGSAGTRQSRRAQYREHSSLSLEDHNGGLETRTVGSMYSCSLPCGGYLGSFDVRRRLTEYPEGLTGVRVRGLELAYSPHFGVIRDVRSMCTRTDSSTNTSIGRCGGAIAQRCSANYDDFEGRWVDEKRL